MVRARRAVVTTPPAGNIGDALTLYRILARLFALLNAWHFPRRALDVFLSGARVALDLGADFHPYATVFRSAYNRQKVGCCVRYHVYETYTIYVRMVVSICISRLLVTAPV